MQPGMKNTYIYIYIYIYKNGYVQIHVKLYYSFFVILQRIASKTGSGSNNCNDNVQNEFKKYYHRYTRYGPAVDCDITCKKAKLCNLVTSNSKDIAAKSIECKQVEHMVDEFHKVKVVEV